MSAFKIEPVRGLATLRVLHGDDSLAAALVCPEDDGTLTLFPVAFEEAPAPLTGEVMRFPDIGAIQAFLGLQDVGGAA